MSQAPRRHLRLENVDGVTVVSFVDTKIVTDENIQEVGDQLYSLVEDEGTSSSCSTSATSSISPAPRSAS